MKALVAMILFFNVGCHSENEPPRQAEDMMNSTKEIPRMSDSPNMLVLKEANASANWFHAKKTRPIWAKRLESAQMVKTLEGEEQVEAGHYLCRGEAGDIWPQTEKDLARRYQTTNEVDADGWRKFRPNPDAEGVMATQIDHPFSVTTSWGTLTGKPGDYLLKNWHDRDTTYPEDVWVVDQKLFRETYERTNPPN